MNRPWSRRAFLASIGAVTVTGCTGDGRGTETKTDTESTPTASTATPTKTATTAEPTPEPPATVDSDWPMPVGDPGRSNGVVDAKGPVDPVQELWSVHLRTAPSVPVVADETVFVGGMDGSVHALDARNGDPRWEADVGAAAGTPSVWDETVFVPLEDWIVALDANDGTEHWRVETGPRSQLLATTHGLYTTSDRERRAVTRYSPADGVERWRTTIDRCGVWPGYLVAGPDHLYVSTGHTRRFPWRLSAKSGTLQTEPEGCYTDSNEIRFYRDGTIVGVNPMAGSVVALTESGDEILWDQSVGIQLGRVGGDTERVYVTTSLSQDAGMTALSLETGSPEWSIEKEWRPKSRPVVTEQSVLCKTDLGLHCFDPTDGTERWTRSEGDHGDEFVVADDIVYTTRGWSVRALR